MARIAIVGAGMSGLSLAWRLRRLKPGWEIVLLEAGSRAGGKAWTVYKDGFVCEKGVNGVLDNKPATLNLAREAGVMPLRSRDAARRRFVVKAAKLVELPDSPKKFLTSSLLSLRGRIRVAGEIFVSPAPPNADESLAEFAVRRLGQEAFQYLIDPMATGIFAGDAAKLSLKSCFPRIHELEQEYGSLIKAMFSLQKKAKKKGKDGPGAGPGGVLTSFPKGMSELVDKLCQQLNPILKLNQKIKMIERREELWRIETEDKTLEATHVVLSCPAYAVAEMFSATLPELAALAVHIPYPPISIVCLGFPAGFAEINLNGFGFLVPSCEKRKILGALWDSSVFEGRAPHGYELVRVLVGGARSPEEALRPDGELLDNVLKEMKHFMGLKKRPEFVEIFRWSKAIPQYLTGHSLLAQKIQAVLSKNKGLMIRCNWLGGVSLNDCVANSEALAASLAA